MNVGRCVLLEMQKMLKTPKEYILSFKREVNSWSSFDQMLLKQKEIVPASGIFFSGGLTHIWCSGEYFWQQDVGMWD